MRDQEVQIRETDEFSSWLTDLKDIRAKVKILARIDRLAHGNPGDSQSVGGGVSEMRLHYGPGYRVYFTRRQLEIVVLLCGGDKSTQESDIKLARRLLEGLQ